MFQDPTDDLSRGGGGNDTWLAILSQRRASNVASSKVVPCKCKTGPTSSLGFI